MATRVNRLEPRLVTPEPEEEEGLRTALDLVRHLGPGSRPRLVTDDGRSVSVPSSLGGALHLILQQLVQGNGVAIVPVNRELTTRQAAELLNVSRQYLSRLLEKGEIPYAKVGTHHRIHLEDALAYKKARDAIRRDQLSNLSQLSQDLGLYDVPGDHCER